MFQCFSVSVAPSSLLIFVIFVFFVVKSFLISSLRSLRSLWLNSSILFSYLPYCLLHIRITSQASIRCHQFQLCPSQSAIYFFLVSFPRTRESSLLRALRFFVVKSSSIAFSFLLSLPPDKLTFRFPLFLFTCRSKIQSWPTGSCICRPTRDKPQPVID